MSGLNLPDPNQISGPTRNGGDNIDDARSTVENGSPKIGIDGNESSRNNRQNMDSNIDKEDLATRPPSSTDIDFGLDNLNVMYYCVRLSFA